MRTQRGSIETRSGSLETKPGAPAPLGSTLVDGGVNFSVFAREAERVSLLLFDSVNAKAPSHTIELSPEVNRSFHYWHVLVPGVAYKKNVSDMRESPSLDIIHLLEYVWKVANAVWGEKHPGREKWVKEQLLLLLESRTEEVIAQWIDLWEADERTNAQKETIDKALTYLNNHREMVDYKSYLAQGLPISTGIVESACGHLVKTRMEQNGMRWSYKGAQAVLDTRAVLKNSDWDDFMEFFIHKEQRRIYPNSPLLRMRA